MRLSWDFMSHITLTPALPTDFPELKRRLQVAFAPAVIAEFGDSLTEPIPSDAELAESFTAPGVEVLHVMHEGKSVGGAGRWCPPIMMAATAIWSYFFSTGPARVAVWDLPRGKP